MQQVLSQIGLVPVGGNYKTVHDRIAKLGLNTSHFTRASWNVGERNRNFSRKAALTEIMVENSPCNFTNGLKNQLKEVVKA